MNTVVVDFVSYEVSVALVLDMIQAPEFLTAQKQILIKPNAVLASHFPVTTNPACVAAIINYIRGCSDAKIIVAEGSSCPDNTTMEVFRYLGYDKLARDKNVELLDLNDHDLIKLTLPGCRIFPSYYIPRIALESFIFNVPVLKRHSLAEVTLGLKNMMGFAPPAHYQKGGYWRKSAFHTHMHRAIIEMNAYRSADMVLLDATQGLAEHHLGGALCDPPVNKLVAGTDLVAVDKIGANLLGLDWRRIKHIAEYDQYVKKLGQVNS